MESFKALYFLLYISANPCRPLAQPLNGFLLCSLAEGGVSSVHETTCRLFCNKGYALPREDGPRNSVFECDHTGTWQPSDIVPSCVSKCQHTWYYSNTCMSQIGWSLIKYSCNKSLFERNTFFHHFFLTFWLATDSKMHVLIIQPVSEWV